jgi:hypothetical protein
VLACMCPASILCAQHAAPISVEGWSLILTAQTVNICALRLSIWPWTEKVSPTLITAASAAAGKCAMQEVLSFVATMYRDQDGSFEAKKYTLILQVPERPGSTSTDKLLMFGSAPINLGQFAVAVGDAPQPLRVEVPLKVRTGRKMIVQGTVQVSIVQAKIALDGMTSLSQGSGASVQPTPSFMQMEQVCSCNVLIMVVQLVTTVYILAALCPWWPRWPQKSMSERLCAPGICNMGMMFWINSLWHGAYRR